MEKDKKSNNSNINKTWILISVLVALTAILLIISVTTKNSTPPPTQKATESTQEKEVAFTTLEISSTPRISSISGRYEIDVTIDTSENEVTNTQLELSYDPSSITIYDIKPGNFMTNPQILQNEIDPSSGRVSYWLEIDKNQKWVQGNGVVAVITFSKSGTASSQINFEPKTSVNANGTNESVLKDMFSAFIETLPTPSPFPTSAVIPTQVPQPEN